MGMGLYILRKVPKFVVGSQLDAHVLRELLKSLHPNLGKYAHIEVFDARLQEAESDARALLEEFDPKSVAAVGVAGRNENEKFIGTRGDDKTRRTVPLDSLVREANEMDLPTHAYLQKVNQVGAGNLQQYGEIPRASDGSVMQATDAVDYPVTGRRADLGAVTTIQRLLQATGHKRQMFKAEDLRDLSYVLFDALRGVGENLQALGGGLEDREATEEIAEAEMKLAKGISTLAKISNTIRENPPQETVEYKRPTDGRPLLAIGENSGLGGAHFVNNMQAYFDVNWDGDHPVRFGAFSNLADAPYGPKSPAELDAAVHRKTAAVDYVGADVKFGACNTMGLALRPEDDEIDLVETTTEAVAKVKNYGPNPVMYATVGMAGSGRYQRGILAASNGEVNPIVIGCPEWAELVDSGKLRSSDPAVIAYVKKMIVGRIEDGVVVEHGPLTLTVKEMRARNLRPDDILNWLSCCTHYADPDLVKLVNKYMREVFEELMGHPGNCEFKDPMVHQAEKVRRALKAKEGEVDRSKRKPSTDPIFVTSDVGGEAFFSLAVSNIRGGATEGHAAFAAPFDPRPNPKLDAIKKHLYEDQE